MRCAVLALMYVSVRAYPQGELNSGDARYAPPWVHPVPFIAGRAPVDNPAPFPAAMFVPRSALTFPINQISGGVPLQNVEYHPRRLVTAQLQDARSHERSPEGIGSQEERNSVQSAPDQFPPRGQKANYVATVTELSNESLPEGAVGPRPAKGPVFGIPPFLEGTSKDIQMKFYEIVSNPDESFNDKQRRLDALVSTLDEKKQELYEEFRKRRDSQEKEKRERIHALVATMSQRAQTAFAKVSAVLTNADMKDRERWERIQRLYASVDDDVRQEFDDRFGGL